eukprot:358695-Chlamydomonas_euryale.AAC.4
MAALAATHGGVVPRSSQAAAAARHCRSDRDRRWRPTGGRGCGAAVAAASAPLAAVRSVSRMPACFAHTCKPWLTKPQPCACTCARAWAAAQPCWCGAASRCPTPAVTAPRAAVKAAAGGPGSSQQSRPLWCAPKASASNGGSGDHNPLGVHALVFTGRWAQSADERDVAARMAGGAGGTESWWWQQLRRGGRVVDGVPEFGGVTAGSFQGVERLSRGGGSSAAGPSEGVDRLGRGGGGGNKGLQGLVGMAGKLSCGMAGAPDGVHTAARPFQDGVERCSGVWDGGTECSANGGASIKVAEGGGGFDCQTVKAPLLRPWKV